MPSLPPVYSVQLFVGRGITGTVDAVIPTDLEVTWVIKDVCAYNGGAFLTTLTISDLISDCELFRFSTEAFVGTQFSESERHVVIPNVMSDDAGFQIVSDGAPWDVYVSGYVLQGIYAPP